MWIPYNKWYHILKQALWAQDYFILGQVSDWRWARIDMFDFLLISYLWVIFMGFHYWARYSGLFSYWSSIVSLAQCEEWISEMEVKAFISDDDSIWVIGRSFDLFFGAAMWIGASIVAPDSKKVIGKVLINILRTIYLRYC